MDWMDVCCFLLCGSFFSFVSCIYINCFRSFIIVVFFVFIFIVLFDVFNVIVRGFIFIFKFKRSIVVFVEGSFFVRGGLDWNGSIYRFFFGYLVCVFLGVSDC